MNISERITNAGLRDNWKYYVNNSGGLSFTSFLYKAITEEDFKDIWISNKESFDEICYDLLEYALTHNP